MAARLVASAAVLVALSLFVACSYSVPVEIFNNTQEDLLIFGGDEGHLVLPGRAQTVKIFMSGGPFLIYTSRGRFAYFVDIQKLPEEFHRLFAGKYRVQIEPDLRAFILKNRDRPPVDPASFEQPQGFPLTPTHEVDWSATSQAVAADAAMLMRYRP